MIHFDPTIVPKGTLKTMAKKLRACPGLEQATLSQRQEILARTFGHPNWHALCQPQPSRVEEAVSSPRVRLIFYRLLLDCLLSRINISWALDAIERPAVLGGEVFLRDLVRHLKVALNSGETFSQAMEKLLGPHAPVEAFFLSQAEINGNLSLGLLHALRSAGEAADARDLQAMEIIT